MQSSVVQSNAGVTQATVQQTASAANAEPSEDIRSMLAKMKDTVANMRRKSLASRQSLAGMGRGAPMTPSTKRQNEFSLLAPSPYVSRLPALGRGTGYVNQEDIVMEESGSQLERAIREENVNGNSEKTSIEIGENIEEEHNLDNSTDSSERQNWTDVPMKDVERIGSMIPKTPRMEGLKEMFRVPRAPPATPLYRGMREMFRTQKEVQTPAYDGIRDMLASPEVPELEEDIVDAGNDDSVYNRPIVRPRRGRSKQETPNASTMADDEATPAEFGPAVTENLVSNINGGVPKGAVVRKGRSRRAASSDREVTNETEDPALSKPRGRSTKARSTTQSNVQDETEPSEESSSVSSCLSVPQ